ncbi:MAG: hypothetical protein AVDCRST_MAG93-2308, partial [uncultured Chloroflexia bacterium]
RENAAHSSISTAHMRYRGRPSITMPTITRASRIGSARSWSHRTHAIRPALCS